MDGGADTTPDAGRVAASRRPARSRPRRRASVTGVLGELLITVGVGVLLYVGWQLWIGDWIIGAQNNADGAELSQTWAAAHPALPTAEPSPTGTATPTDPATLQPAADGQRFGVVHIPRFGTDYAVIVAGGVTKPRTLDRHMIGHYLDTQMPGEVGNFALAGHRTTYGAPFGPIADLRIGDAIVIETQEGWYTYRFRTLEYVTPDAVDVLQSVPQASATPDGERYLTLTSCSPRYSNTERIVAYGVFDSFTPRADGPPASLDPVKGS